MKTLLSNDEKVIADNGYAENRCMRVLLHAGPQVGAERVAHLRPVVSGRQATAEVSR